MVDGMDSRRRALGRLALAAGALVGAACTMSMLPARAADESAADRVRAASRWAQQGRSADAVAELTKAIEQEPTLATAYYVRGREHFRLGKIKESAADFDKYVELAPEFASRQWERGITLYYAGRFADGAKQFEDYQTFHNQDVENSVWRYLCVARAKNVAEARATMLPIEQDPRVPMMDVFEMYRGNRKPDEVLAAARAGKPTDEALAGRLFYAHLYLGLFFEAQGDAEQARKYIALAADPKLATHPRINGYMWDVARIHHERMKK